MQIRFLLGPAGVGKTWRCLEEIRRELLQQPAGLPLIFLAPKQATFQLERQLLDGQPLQAYTRLRILSFERLAHFILDQLGHPEPSVLSEEGRVMVLRALLQNGSANLSIFKNSARRPGFASELSVQLREFQNHGLTPEDVAALANNTPRAQLRNKLGDLSRLFREYLRWLRDHELEDADAILGFTSDLIASLDPAQKSKIQIGEVWFDGFAQLTPRERTFLASIVELSRRSTLAFCLDPSTSGNSLLNHWGGIEYSYSRCRGEIGARFPLAQISIEHLPRGQSPGRFASAPALSHLEAHWRSAQPFDSAAGIDLVECMDPETEVTHCAREILKHVRNGGRFRDVALLLRGFENDYPHVIRHVFSRYEIPFFLDHRANVAHHPIAQLTRGALRTVAGNWKIQDWMTALKSGLVLPGSVDLDELENEALARGWEGKVWTEGIQIRDFPEREKQLNKLRARLVAPFQALAGALGQQPSGTELADALQAFWDALEVRASLEKMVTGSGEVLHNTVWTQMESWLANVRLAFAHNRLPLRDWLPIIESGLAGLTVGAIPPSLDQVLVGAVDRSRNPDLKMLCVIGFNEGVFPALVAQGGLLGEHDRAALLDLGSELGRLPSLQLFQEQFYGYIACTRARERLVVTYAKNSADSAPLNPSRFVAHLKRLLPGLQTRTADFDISDVAHARELARFQLSPSDLALLSNGPSDTVRRWQEQFGQMSLPDPNESLGGELASRLYGSRLNVGVSSLEKYASCAFRFFLEQGLGARERDLFSLDVREQGSLVHDVLKLLHEVIRDGKREWRHVPVEEARQLVNHLADRVSADFRDGLANASEKNKFTAETCKMLLERFIDVIWPWFNTNEFDPAEVEYSFGPEEKHDSEPCRIPLDGGRELILNGRADRIDTYKRDDGKVLFAVIDYKTGQVRPNAVYLEHGIQLQLTAYLLAFVESSKLAADGKKAELIPAGAFYVPLKGSPKGAVTRLEAGEAAVDTKKGIFAHNGIFNFQHLQRFDSRLNDEVSGQFVYRLKEKNPIPSLKPFGLFTDADFSALLAKTRENLARFGREIFEGRTDIKPFRKGGVIACDKCKFQPVCRFDPWIQEFRVLKPAPKAEDSKPARKKKERSSK